MALDNFVLQNTNPLEAYLQGAQGIQTLQNNNQVMQARQLAQQQAQQQAEADLSAALQKKQMQMDLYNTTDPLLLAKKTAAYQLAHPDDYKAVEASSKTLSDAQRKSVQGITAQVTSAVSSGRKELGQQVLDDYVKGLENSGAPDDQIAGAKFFQKQYSHDPQSAITAMNLGARALDPENYDTNNKVAAETAGIIAKQPLEQAETQASTEQKISATRKNYFDIADQKEKNVIARMQLLADKAKTALEREKLQTEIEGKKQELSTKQTERAAAGKQLISGFSELKNKAIELLKDPALDSIVGGFQGDWQPNKTQTESQRAAQAKLDTIKSGIFLTVSPVLTGTQTAQDAIDMKNAFAALNTGMGEKAFKNELRKLITQMSEKVKLAREQYGQPDQSGSTGVSKDQPSFDIKSTSYGALLGGK